MSSGLYFYLSFCCSGCRCCCRRLLMLLLVAAAVFTYTEPIAFVSLVKTSHVTQASDRNLFDTTRYPGPYGHLLFCPSPLFYFAPLYFYHSTPVCPFAQFFCLPVLVSNPSGPLFYYSQGFFVTVRAGAAYRHLFPRQYIF